MEGVAIDQIDYGIFVVKIAGLKGVEVPINIMRHRFHPFDPPSDPPMTFSMPPSSPTSPSIP